MRHFYFMICACGLLFSSCSEEELTRCDGFSIDNPTSDEYYFVVDDDTLYLPAYTCIANYVPICTGKPPLKPLDDWGHGKHHFQFLSIDKRLLFDTTFVVDMNYPILNPTRHKYVKWSIDYDRAGTPGSSTEIDGIEYFGDIEFLGIAFVIPGGDYLSYERNVDSKIEAIAHSLSQKTYLFRIEDFIVAYYESGVTNSDDNNLLRMNSLTKTLFEQVNSDRETIFSTGELALMDSLMKVEDYAGALNQMRDQCAYMSNLNFQAFTEACDMYVRLEESERVNTGVPPFTDLHHVKYKYIDNKPVFDYSMEYDPATGMTMMDINPPEGYPENSR